MILGNSHPESNNHSAKIVCYILKLSIFILFSVSFKIFAPWAFSRLRTAFAD